MRGGDCPPGTVVILVPPKDPAARRHLVVTAVPPDENPEATAAALSRTFEAPGTIVAVRRDGRWRKFTLMGPGAVIGRGGRAGGSSRPDRRGVASSPRGETIACLLA